MNTLIKTHSEIQIEPLCTRVAFHPFLAGMNHTQLTLLTDCAVARHFNTNQIILREGEFANGFYLVETGKVALESEAGFGEIDPDTTPWPQETCSAGHGCFRRTSGNLQPARSSRPLCCFSTQQFCGNTAKTGNHLLGYELLKRISAVMVTRLQAAHDQMLSLYCNTRVA